MRMSGHLLPSANARDWSDALVGNDHVELAVTLRLWNEENAYQTMRQRHQAWTVAELHAAHGVPVDVRTKIVEWLVHRGLVVTGESPLVIWLEGTFEAVSQTFGLAFEYRQEGKVRQFRPSREPTVPDWAVPWITGVVGLQNVARLTPHLRQPQRTEELANGGQGFFPQDIRQAYQFPPQWDGSGETLGLLEFSNGYNQNDVMAFWESVHIVPPALAFVSVDGTANDGGVNPQDLEATLDVEWAGALAPGAQLVVYEANSGTSDCGFGLSVLRALDYAVHDMTYRPTVLSISYGDAESRFPAAEMHAWDAVMTEAGLLGVTICVASGDEGAYGLNGPGWPICHVDAPANCSHAVAVGGTHLLLAPTGDIALETGWTDTNNNGASGGGISQMFAIPPYQSALDLPVKPYDKLGRGVPDVAANADPDTGYAVYFQGAATVVGGTSAASPLWAALFTRLNQARAHQQLGPVGYVNPILYNLGLTSAFRDITVGNNNYGWVVGYECGPGWDAVTGWGSPHGAVLVEQFVSLQT
ncbi:MAG: peptidase [Sulfobacillus acidophilus]|uniref:Peptidase n=1 Tax=Sulfobacillus acidophilus TaxID=53633 RepID=A0A2T2WLC1_9FIRM|nr:MAG: peptidase [Sulfobacillus acidophilus]